MLKNYAKQVMATVMLMMSIVVTPVTAFAKTEVDVPQNVAEAANYYGGMYGIDTELILALIFTESSYDRKVENGVHKGLMQVNEKLHAGIIKDKGVTDIYDVDSNINIGCKVLYDIMEDDKDIYSALMKYNGDTAGLKKYQKTGTPSYYASSIVKLQEKLEKEINIY